MHLVWRRFFANKDTRQGGGVVKEAIVDISAENVFLVEGSLRLVSSFEKTPHSFKSVQPHPPL